jgi:hypothetical protein
MNRIRNIALGAACISMGGAWGADTGRAHRLGTLIVAGPAPPDEGCKRTPAQHLEPSAESGMFAHRVKRMKSRRREQHDA